MTVQELIDHLGKFPPGARVIITMYSDYRDLEAEQVIFVPATSREIAIRYQQGTRRYVDFVPTVWPAEETPVFEDLCHFPGN